MVVDVEAAAEALFEVAHGLLRPFLPIAVDVLGVGPDVDPLGRHQRPTGPTGGFGPRGQHRRQQRRQGQDRDDESPPWADDENTMNSADGG